MKAHSMDLRERVFKDLAGGPEDLGSGREVLGQPVVGAQDATPKLEPL